MNFGVSPSCNYLVVTVIVHLFRFINGGFFLLLCVYYCHCCGCFIVRHLRACRTLSMVQLNISYCPPSKVKKCTHDQLTERSNGVLRITGHTNQLAVVSHIKLSNSFQGLIKEILFGQLPYRVIIIHTSGVGMSYE